MPVNAALFHEARQLTTGANNHKLTGALAMYRAAADDPTAASQKAASDMERDLLAYLVKLRSQRARGQR